MLEVSIEWGLPALLQVVQHADPLPRTALDVGSGTGQHARLLRHFGIEVTTLDRNQSADICGDLLGMDFGGRQFGLVWASHVLEHQRNPGAFLDRLVDLCETDGILALTVPNHTRHGIVPGHCQVYSAALLAYQMVLAGVDCRGASLMSSREISLVTYNRPARHAEYRHPAACGMEGIQEYLPPGIAGNVALPQVLAINWRPVSLGWFEAQGVTIRAPLWEDLIRAS